MTEAPAFGLYVHWPFCQSKCPYCDFNSHVSANVDHESWQKALVSEVERVARDTPGRRLNSIFFGGGTPSLMPPATVEAVIAAAQREWRFANDIEITLEANPTSVEADRFAAYRLAGVNRVSVGVQALDDGDLRRLGRLHSADEARNAVAVAAKTFDRFSFDLIYARQDQTLDAWRRELDEALALARDHISLYQLTIEPGTAFGERRARGRLAGLPDEDLAADMFTMTQELTEAAGFPAYETSNHARPSAESRHNLIYWTGGDWAGVGPGAHGRLTLDGHRIATECHANPSTWLRAVESGGTGDSRRAAVPADEVLEERLMMGLRLARGIDLPEDALTRMRADKIDEFERLGLLSLGDRHMTVLPPGRPVLNAILAGLLA